MRIFNNSTQFSKKQSFQTMLSFQIISMTHTQYYERNNPLSIENDPEDIKMGTDNHIISICIV